ncbi:YihA family ribosome biogenesis GTP-binding protein [Oribacterium sp. C9]|uniref:ribosome biogenesis GTP-binding protein YihA/YsxC n=1 Tax=Oribacterium sp. C9 TaxID=1943579 RepID=UPI00098ED82E|nr:ribosome biogenesis GTP-binding protein YihA/YsxC [Oribacterium sp. C9]OON85513.1 YihA family ribosome biogenesis GTP-binding protein [Oribacterium sp. C9]
MKIVSVNLEQVLGVKSELPSTGKPEFVMAGRSNVGKSSFINAFINRKNYARTSSTPGKTRTINFYNINERFYLVDLPGYGYAATGAVEQEKWGRMINKYLQTSEDIEEVIQFVDIRHEPSKQDVQMFDFVKQSTGFEPIVILTKADKIKRSQIKKQTDVIRKCLNATTNCVMIPFSSETKQGLSDIYAIIDDIIDTPEKTEE